MVTTLCYLAGALVGTVATRSGTPQWWRHAVRTQLLVVGSSIALVAGWRATAGGDLVPALALAAPTYVLFAVTALWRGPATRGAAALEAWSCIANTGFFVIPVTVALLGPSAAAVAVLADEACAPAGMWATARLRRDAPLPQHGRTALTDYAPQAGLVVGFVAGLFTPAPRWTVTAVAVLAPALALTGAAVWAGSVRHLLGRLDRPASPDWRRWAALTSVRVAVCMAVAALWWHTPVAAVAALVAAGAPAFLPASLTVLYGYRSPLVGISARWGWLAAPLGLVAAVLLAGR